MTTTSKTKRMGFGNATYKRHVNVKYDAVSNFKLTHSGHCSSKCCTRQSCCKPQISEWFWNNCYSKLKFDFQSWKFRDTYTLWLKLSCFAQVEVRQVCKVQKQATITVHALFVSKSGFFIGASHDLESIWGFNKALNKCTNNPEWLFWLRETSEYSKNIFETRFLKTLAWKWVRICWLLWQTFQTQIRRV